MNDFYVYEWLDADGVTVYVGKGCRGRVENHLLVARRMNAGGKNKSNSRFLRWLAKQLRENKPTSHRIVAAGLPERDALELEVQLIAAHKRLEDGGTLYNLAHGGAGMTSEAMKELWRDEAYRSRFIAHLRDPEKRAAAFAHLRSPERRAAAASWMKRFWLSEGAVDSRAKLVARNRSELIERNSVLRKDEAFVARHAQATKAGIAAMPEEKRKAKAAKTSAAMNVAWSDPSRKERWVAATKEANGRPHRRQQSREKALQEWAKPERKAAASQRAKELWADPEWAAQRRKELVERNQKGKRQS